MSSFVVRVDLRDTPVWATNTPAAQACVCRAFTKVFVPIVDPRFVQRHKDLECALGYVDPKYAGCFDPEDPSRLKYFKSRLYMSHDSTFFSDDVAAKFEAELRGCGFFPTANNFTHPGLNGPIRRDGEDDVSWKVSGALFVSILVMLVLKTLFGEIRATCDRRSKAKVTAQQPPTPPPPPPPPPASDGDDDEEDDDDADERAKMIEMDSKV